MIAPARRANRRRGLNIVLAAATACLAIGSAQAQTYPGYTVAALPITDFTAFNDRGQILGRAFLPCTGLCTQSDAPALYDTVTGTITALPGGFGATTQFGAINALGQLAGTQTSRDATGALVRTVVIRQPDGTLTPVAAPALSATLGSPLQVRGFSADGKIALQYTDGLDVLAPNCGSYLGWLGSTSGAWQALGPAGTLVSLSGINGGGRAVGAAVAPAACLGVGAGYRAVAAQPNGTLVDLHGSLPGVFSRARAINDLGYAVGEADSGLRTAPDAFNPQGVPILRGMVWNTSSLAAFDIGPAGSSTRLNAANARGEVVGRSTGPVSTTQPITGATTVAVLGNLATTLPMANLNTLLTSNSSGWVLQEALAVNAAGQIVARGTSTAGSGYALLTPVQAPVDPYATVPSAPASLSAVVSPSTPVKLTWMNTARNATRLVVERCKGSTCRTFAAVATLPGDTSTWLDTTTAKRTAYRYRVRAGNATGLSAPSNVVSITTPR